VKKISADWTAMQTLAVFEEVGTFAGTARRLGLTHATVSRRLQQLEEQVGGALFVRRGDELELTAAGRAACASAQRMLAEAHALERSLAGQDVQVEGPVRIATTESLGMALLAPRLGALQAAWPGLALELFTSNHVASLARRDADISLRFARPAGGELIAKKIGRIDYFLCAATGTDTDAASCRYVGFDATVPDIPERQWFDTHVAPERVAVRSNSLLVQRNAIAGGAGVGLLLAHLAAGLEQVSPRPLLSREIWSVIHRDMRHVPRIRVVLDWLAELCRTPAEK